ncbi:sensor histidine kinase [Vibrio alginolyticus]|nr:sensor histidine kinase [Vibrio alginolyticus]ELB2808527.1 sensor histidine kinase [Vibrio alginolyticus]
MKSEADLKQELIELLTSEARGEQGNGLDYGRILDLSSQISKHDKGNVRFSVDAKIVERLGEQLVAKKTTALSELIKNAYDADAKTVIVRFEGTEAPGGVIRISDDGSGMDYDSLINAFMTISTSDKVSNPISTKYQRPRAGKKGIGRFSAQKIGKKLRLVTKREEDELYLCIDIDWEQFESGIILNAISNKVTYLSQGYDFKSGTILEIGNVREAWTQQNIKTTFNYISSIIHAQNSGSNNKDPGFRPKFYYSPNGSSEETIELDDVSEYLSAADLKAEGYMTPDGRFEIVVESSLDERLNDVIELEGFNKLLFDVGFRVEFLYFAMSKESKSVKGLQNYLNNNAGIKFYRNGFNVAPYGERYNDWLALDESSRRRLIIPPHANTNYLGQVSVKDLDGKYFEETSAREGVIENDAFKALTEATKAMAVKVASHVAVIREKKVTASQQGFKSKRASKEEKLREQLEEMRLKLEAKQAEEEERQRERESEGASSDETHDSDNRSQKDSSSFNASDFIDELEAVNETLNEYIDEQLMYRVLSSMGLAISEFTHEIQTCLTNLNLNSQSLGLLVNEEPKLTQISSQLQENLGMLNAYTDFFDGTMRSNSNKEKNHYDMRKLIKRFISAMEPTTKRRGYEIDTYFDSWEIWTKKVHISEVMSIFINLFTNSCKAIERSGIAQGKILLHVATDTNFMTIRFEDNGDGIPEDKWADVFAPLYTTAMPASAYSSDHDYNRGMGLGLSITEQIITEMHGEIAVDSPSEGYSTCIKITLPTVGEDELPDYVY